MSFTTNYRTGAPTTAKNSGALGRLHSEEVAAVLGFEAHDIPILVSNGLLEPLGKPPVPNCKKFFARISVMQLAEDLKWLSKATTVLYLHWQGKNDRRRKGEDSGREGIGLN